MTNWESRRRRLNHDILKNQLLQSLSRIIRILEGRTRENILLTELCQLFSTTWRHLNMEAQNLLDSAAYEMSPASWFLQYPLNQLNSIDRIWMEELLISKWKRTSDLSESLNETRLTLNDIDLYCKTLFLNLTLLETDNSQTKIYHEAINTEALTCALTVYEKCQHLSYRLTSLASQDVINVLSTISHATNI